jgi:hypothetical protein
MAELLLLGHYEDTWQWTPLVLLGPGLVVGAWVLMRPTVGLVSSLRVLSVVFVISGAVGVFLHLKSNVEFELELHPSMEGMELIWETLHGAIPALAPGTMVWMGLLGLLACFRYPSGSDGRT